MNGKIVSEMDARDKEFYEHIKKNRADARLNSIRNPVPDYYGEKIQSVHGYREWLRKQREHYRKGVFGGEASELDD
jgi:import inner membrane translocase subunit TIM23